MKLDAQLCCVYTENFRSKRTSQRSSDTSRNTHLSTKRKMIISAKSLNSNSKTLNVLSIRMCLCCHFVQNNTTESRTVLECSCSLNFSQSGTINCLFIRHCFSGYTAERYQIKLEHCYTPIFGIGLLSLLVYMQHLPYSSKLLLLKLYSILDLNILQRYLMCIPCTDVTCLLSIDYCIHKHAFACAILYHSMFFLSLLPAIPEDSKDFSGIDFCISKRITNGNRCVKSDKKHQCVTFR